jgi:hypothetical protein
MSAGLVVPLTLPRSFAAIFDEVLNETDAADPHVIAAKVEEQVTDDMLREALRAVLPTFIRSRLSLARRLTVNQDIKKALGPTGSPQQGRSWKVEGIRAIADKIRHQRWAIDGANSQWKLLRDCTVDDLARIASVRRDVATANLTKAEQIDRLREALKSKGVSTVGDLTDDELLAAMQG